MSRMVRIFVSHSSEDAHLAAALVDLLQAALALPAKEIRCTSLDGYRLPGGALTAEQLRREVLATDAFLGLISKSSLRSLFVAFELGARWGAAKSLVPLLAPGLTASVLEGPLKDCA